MPTSVRRRARAAAVLAGCVALAGTTTAASGGTSDPTPAVLQIARQQVGDAYAWGGNGPDAWDCSGFTSYMWGVVGGVASIPRTSAAQQAWAVPLPAEQLRPGDLVFFGHPVDHVGIYTGGGRMVDASSSRGGVVERAVWTSGLVRYGRVPRPGMVAVTPWTPPPLPAPSAAPAPRTTEPPRASRSGAAKPVALVPLRGLPGVQRGASSDVAVRAVAGARTVVGRRGWTDVALVRTAWRHAGGGTLPEDRGGVVGRAKAVALADARVGDLVVYGRPAARIALYAGHGYMVDASPHHGKVVVRRVYADPTVRLARLG